MVGFDAANDCTITLCKHDSIKQSLINLRIIWASLGILILYICIMNKYVEQTTICGRIL